MSSLPWTALAVATLLALPVRAEVTLDRSEGRVVLENALVRVEMRKDHNFQPTVMQISGVGVTLTTVTDDSDGFFLYDFYIRIFVVVNLRQNFSPYLLT